MNPNGGDYHHLHKTLTQCIGVLRQRGQARPRRAMTMPAPPMIRLSTVDAALPCNPPDSIALIVSMGPQQMVAVDFLGQHETRMKIGTVIGTHRKRCWHPPCEFARQGRLLKGGRLHPQRHGVPRPNTRPHWLGPGRLPPCSHAVVASGNKKKECFDF
jgi:hypothetical protein